MLAGISILAQKLLRSFMPYVLQRDTVVRQAEKNRNQSKKPGKAHTIKIC